MTAQSWMRLIPALSSSILLLNSRILVSNLLVRQASTFAMNMAGLTFLNANTAKVIDEKLMESPGFSLDQLMELAGYSIACASNAFMTERPSGVSTKKLLVYCGPGNNGGDGLVAARHLKHFGYEPTIIYPKKGKIPLFDGLVRQCENLDIPILTSDDSLNRSDARLVIDGLFGFSFDGPPRAPFVDIIANFATSSVPVLSIDIPSGWDVNKGDIHNTKFIPDAVISLTLPKLCMQTYTGKHYIGGRFIPNKLAQELNLILPTYEGDKQYAELTTPSNNNIININNIDITEDHGRQLAQDEETIVAIFATASSKVEAKKIASQLILHKLVACVNIIPHVESIYEWEGKVEESEEVIMMIKTKRSLIDSVTTMIKSLHSYQVPESIAVNIIGGNLDYIKWVKDQTKAK